MVSIAVIAFLSIGALLSLALDVFTKNRSYVKIAVYLTCIVALFFAIKLWDFTGYYFSKLVFIDRMGIFAAVLAILATFFVLLMSETYVPLMGIKDNEYYYLLLLATAGAVAMLFTDHLVVLFVAMELMSVASYALAGIRKKDPLSTEAAIKYVLLGVLTSGIYVLGLAFILGATGTFRIYDASLNSSLFNLIGAVLLLSALMFKVSMVPFHVWTPDVYQGAPTPITAYFSTVPKIAGFVALIRLSGYLAYLPVLTFFLGAVILTLVYANFVALRQKDVKRLLAYSSIAHAGYLGMGILLGEAQAWVVLFYLAVYTFMNIGAFSVVAAMLEGDREFTSLESYEGLGYSYPWLGAGMTLMLVSLAGFPPTGGFLAKFYLFSRVLFAGWTWLVVLAVLMSLLSVYYYLRVVVQMYMKSLEGKVGIYQYNIGANLALFAGILIVLELGIFPQTLLFLLRFGI